MFCYDSVNTSSISMKISVQLCVLYNLTKFSNSSILNFVQPLCPVHKANPSLMSKETSVFSPAGRVVCFLISNEVLMFFRMILLTCPFESPLVCVTQEANRINKRLKSECCADQQASFPAHLGLISIDEHL